jgi:glycosyltransferase involved in cell wall biosynthesis
VDLNSPLPVLIISYAFPPLAEVGALRIARFCRYLPSCGIQPIVVAPGQQHINCDDSVPLPSGLCVERTRVVTTPLDLYVRLKTRIGFEGAGNSPQGRGVDSSVGPIKKQLLALLQIPDPYWGWYWPALHAAEKIIEREPIAAIFSSAPPWTAHLVARRLKKKYRIPWVADFRDPWTLAPYQNRVPIWRKGVDRRLEGSLVRWADLVISVTEDMRQAFERQYPTMPATKFVTLTNGFDDLTPSPSPKKEEGGKKLFLHLGSLYAGRRIDTFCKAARDLVNAGKLDPQSFKILFLGDNDPSLVAGAYEAAPELIQSKCIEFQNQISWQRAQEVLGTADVLLLFQGGHRLQIPAKFYEYLKTGKPILAIAEQGALTNLIEATGSGVWADPRDPERIGHMLLETLALPPRPPEAIERFASRFHPEHLTAQLASWFRQLAAERSKMQEQGN